MRARAALAAVAISTAAIGCAGPGLPRSALEGWSHVDTGRIRLIGDTSAAEIQALAGDLAAFEAALAHLLGAPLEVEAAIVLLRGPFFAGRLEVDGAVGGWAMRTLEEAHACVSLRGSPSEVRRVLFHEFTHLVLTQNRQAPLPRWYEEGLAIYFSTLAQRDGALVVGAVPAGRLGWLSHRGAVPLDRLFERRLGPRLDEALDYYATAWALNHLLLGTPAGRSQLFRFTDALARGTPWQDAFAQSFPRPLEDLAEALETHVGHLRRGVPVEIVLDPREIRIETPPPAEPLAGDEIARHLGGLATALADGGGPERLRGLARGLLAIALEDDPSDARTRAAFARAAVLADAHEEAALEIARALAEAPDDPGVLVRAGEIALASDAREEAEGHFRRALSLETSARAWFGLGRALAGGEDPDRALEALLRARAFGWSDALDLEIGRLHLAAGREEEALRLLSPLARDPHRGRAGEDAEGLLRDAERAPADGP